MSHILRSNNISISFGGDFCPSSRVQDYLKKGQVDEDDILGSVQTLFASSDINIINLECPLSDSGSPIVKEGPNFHASPSMIQLLTHIGVTGVTLANNHIRDYGDAGVIDTLELCAANGIKTVGAGMTLELARQPLYINVNERIVAFINVAEHEFSIATANQAGANPFDLINLLNDLKQARLQTDHVILIVHGGLEMTHVPSPQSVRSLRFVAEQGVTAVIRHHSHHIQGYEVWNGVPIFYGLGNMFFDLEGMNSCWYKGLLLKLDISSDNTCSFELFPISQCEHGLSVKVLDGDEKLNMFKIINDYTSLLSDEKMLLQAWDKVINSVKQDYFSRLLLPSITLRPFIRRLPFMKFFKPGMKFLRYINNILTCDTHREVLIDIIKTQHFN